MKIPICKPQCDEWKLRFLRLTTLGRRIMKCQECRSTFMRDAEKKLPLKTLDNEISWGVQSMYSN